MSKKLKIIAALITIITGSLTILITAFTFLSGQGTLPGFLATYNSANIWTTKEQNFAPSCDASDKSNWMIPKEIKPSTNVQCLVQGLEITPSSTASLAEIDLDRINGQTYNQTKLDVEIQVTFGSKSDTNTMAGLVVQTPQQGSGGYGLAINNTGYWELVNSGHRQASAGFVTSRTIFTIEMKVQHGNLYGSIDGKQVFMFSDALNPSLGAIGLIVYGSNPPLSPVLFSDFTLKL